MRPGDPRGIPFQILLSWVMQPTAFRRNRLFEVRANCEAITRCLITGRFVRIPFVLRGLFRAVTP